MLNLQQKFININKFIPNTTTDQYKIEATMGTQCTKPARQYRKPIIKPIYNETPMPQSQSPLKKTFQTYLSIYSPSSSNKDSINSRVHKKKLEDKTNEGWVKYSEKYGFCDYDQTVNDYRQINNDQKNDGEILFHVQKSQLGNYFLELQGENKKIYKKIEQQEVQLIERDQILKGSLSIKLKYWLTPKETHYFRNKTQVRLNLCKDNSAECRICLENDIDHQNNPLLHPCRCTGSTGAIHQRCLSRWIFGTSVPFQQTMNSYKIDIKNYACQICKKSFTDYIWSRIMTIVSSFQGHYAIFEVKSLPEAKKKENPSFFILKFVDQSEILQMPQIGKSISDIKIVRTGQELYIHDNSVKKQMYISNSVQYIAGGAEYRIGNLRLQIQTKLISKE